MFGFGIQGVGKSWGTSVRLSRSDESLLMMINVLPGGYCSRHWHEYRVNWFMVAEGSLTLRQWETTGLESENIIGEQEEDVILTPDSGAVFVPCNKLHQFISPTGCKAIEIYTSPSGVVDEDDIVRISTGGIEKDE